MYQYYISTISNVFSGSKMYKQLWNKFTGCGCLGYRALIKHNVPGYIVVAHFSKK